MKRAERAHEILSRLSRRYPHPDTELHWTTPWQLMVAVALSAQCTDVQVNKVTPALFSRWPGPEHILAADVAAIEELIHSTGFFRQKAKNLKGAARVVMEEFAGEMPRSMQELIRLPGVARKTANIILSTAFGIQEGIAVDTHVKRLSFRMGLTRSTDVKVIERDLMKNFPREQWGDVNHRLVLFGREICPARKPRCPDCELADICPRHGVKAQ